MLAPGLLVTILALVAGHASADTGPVQKPSCAAKDSPPVKCINDKAQPAQEAVWLSSDISKSLSSATDVEHANSCGDKKWSATNGKGQKIYVTGRIAGSTYTVCTVGFKTDWYCNCQ